MIDCGESTQLQFRHTRLNYNKIQDVFISHLHGDHCFGLIGMISTMGMLGRHAPLTIHSQSELESLMKCQLDFFCRELPYEVRFVPFDPGKSAMIFEDRSIEVYTLPLIHRIPSAGFLFREKQGGRHIIKGMTDFYNVPLKELPGIKEGADFIAPDGEVVPNDRLTTPPSHAKSYAYCSDTAYNESLIPLIKGVDLLFHEATFGEDERDKANFTLHSTAADAGKIAREACVGKLLIGHYSARYPDEKCLLQEARNEFENVILAHEDQRIEI